MKSVPFRSDALVAMPCLSIVLQPSEKCLTSNWHEWLMGVKSIALPELAHTAIDTYVHIWDSVHSFIHLFPNLKANIEITNNNWWMYIIQKII